MFFHFATKEPRILVIDDDGSLQRMVRAHLKHHTDYEVIEALDGTSGLAHARHDQPTLILLDWMLPDIEGVEVLRKLKSTKQTCNIPVLMMTGRNKISDIEGAFKLGAEDYLTKPFPLEKLKNKLKHLLNSV